MQPTELLRIRRIQGGKNMVASKTARSQLVALAFVASVLCAAAGTAEGALGGRGWRAGGAG